MRIDTTLKAAIQVVCGSSGSGKSVTIKKRLQKEKRLIIWDVDDEYTGEMGIPGCQRFTCLRQLADRLRTAKAGKFAYVGKPSDFNNWCRLVFAWGYCAAVAEETAGVTSPAKAPEGWHTLVSRGRKRGIKPLVGVTQRPAESDKTIMGNCSSIQCGLLTRAKDRKYMADELDIPVEYITRLGEEEYIRLEVRKKAYFHGKITTPPEGTPNPLTKVRIKETPLTIER
ncbi:hypothetical protein [Marinobacter alkaliphilus]|uniref:hypothetical protein n=1 Tax=Marinobacter alkaliphilus TaxID=254719 RepID=UPI003D766A0A